MADQDSILGTSGKESIPFEYQTEQQRIARKRSMAQMMLQKGLAGPRATQMFGIHASTPGVGEHLISALQTYMGMKGQNQADQDLTDMGQRMQTEQQADLQGAMDLQGTDPKGAIARAMASKFGRVQGMGAQWAKDRQAMLLEQGKMLGTADPVRGIQHLQGGNPEAPVAPLAAPQPTFGTDPAGNAYGLTTDAKGTKPTLSYAPKPMSVNVDNKMTNNANEDAAKYFNYGGKGFDKGVAASQGLQNTANLLDTLDKDPTMGAGANAFQFIRKWAETLGVPTSEKTTPTEMVNMQLGQKTLDRLGGLGAQVSDADRKFMQETQGSIGNDPEAVRRMLLIEAKYLMQVQAQTSGQATEVAGRVPGMTLPQHTFSFTPSQRNADDLERLFTGKGFAPPAPAPVKQYPGRIRSAK